MTEPDAVADFAIDASPFTRGVVHDSDREHSTRETLWYVFDDLPDPGEVLGESFTEAQEQAFEAWLRAAKSVRVTENHPA